MGQKKSQHDGPGDVLVTEDGYRHNAQVISCRESARTWIDCLGGSGDDAHDDHFERRGIRRKLTYKRRRAEERRHMEYLYIISSYVVSPDEARVQMDKYSQSVGVKIRDKSQPKVPQ